MNAFLSSRRAVLAGLAVAPMVPILARAEALQRVSIVLDWKAGPTHAGLYLARESGAFRHRGIDIHIAEGHGAKITAEMVGAGQEYWIGICRAAATAIGRSNGQAVRSLAVYYRREPSVLYARAADRIDAPRDLYGKRVGIVPGSFMTDQYRALLAANRLNRSRIKEIEVESGPQALLSHKVDALIDYEESAPAELQAQGQKISTLRFADYGVRLYSLNLIVNESAWMDPVRQEIARKIAEAIADGYQVVRDRPAYAASLFSRLFPEFSARYVELSMQIVSRQLATPIGSQTRLGWEDTLKTLSSLRLLTRAVSAEEVAIYD